jgi:hypothetical protein
MAVADDVPRSWSVASLVALTMVVVVPAWLSIAAGHATWYLVPVGAGIWGASVYAKRLVMGSASARLPDMRMSDAARSASHGAVSAAMELVPAAAFLVTLRSASLADLIAFGAGAGSAEAAYVLLLGIIRPQIDPDELQAWLRGAAVSWCVRYAVPIERLFALVGHVGSRGLLYVAMMAGGPLGVLWGLAAVSLFTAIDGVAVYGHLKRWQWHDPMICRRAHSFFAALSLAELLLLLVGFQDLG